jgi:Zn-dependent protease
MIPVPPLDGSRLLYAFAPEPLQRVMQTIEQFGLVTIFIIVFVLWQFIGPIIINLNQSILFFLLGISG